MKLTWFGGTALRIYLGGQIVVVDPDAAPAGVDRGELLAGADRIVAAGDGLTPVDPALWGAKPMPRLMDEVPAAEVVRIGQALLVAAAGEPALVIAGPGEVPMAGRWADRAVIVLTNVDEGLVADIAALLDAARPRLIALAAGEETLDWSVEALAGHLNETGLASLEAGLALEV
jgi:hypothetical protein